MASESDLAIKAVNASQLLRAFDNSNGFVVINETKKLLKYPPSPIELKIEFTKGSTIVSTALPNYLPKILPKKSHSCSFNIPCSSR